MLAIVPVSLLALAGCGSPAKYIETGSPQSVVSVGEVDMQDVLKASSGKVVNDTSSQFDVGELLFRMREQMVNSGQAQVVTTFGANAEDKTAQDALRAQAFRQGNQVDGMPAPDFSLSGKITQMKRQAGNTRQTTYTFRLTLTNMRTGLEVWTKTVDMTKQGTRDAVGF
jgi:PBP1b-binding outer membrane lipoprotein LpoB